MSELVEGKYENGVTFYPDPDLYLFQIAKLWFNFPQHFAEFREPLFTALNKRLQK